ncbi:MAG: hypothetical protein WC901_02780 [Candidatus Margulisiibacteriota bacterium]
MEHTAAEGKNTAPILVVRQKNFLRLRKREEGEQINNDSVSELTRFHHNSETPRKTAGLRAGRFVQIVTWQGEGENWEEMINKKLVISNNELGINETVTLAFSEEDYSQLSAFHEKAIMLFGLELFARGLNLKTQINWRKGEGLRVQVELPKDDDVSSLLHRLRPFILQGEITNFYEITNLLSRNIQNLQIRGLLKEARETWSGVAAASVMQVTMMISGEGTNDNQKIISDEFLHKWLNAYEYHSDIEKKTSIDNLHKYFPLEATKALLINLLIEKVRAIACLNGLVDLILGNQSEQAATFIIGEKYVKAAA